MPGIAHLKVPPLETIMAIRKRNIMFNFRDNSLLMHNVKSNWYIDCVTALIIREKKRKKKKKGEKKPQKIKESSTF